MFSEINNFLGRKWKCENCNLEHSVPTKWVKIAEGAFELLTDFASRVGCNKSAIVVADEITWEVAGVKVTNSLNEAGWQVCRIVLPLPLHATDEVANSLLSQWSHDASLAFAVGSGTINDLVKWVATQMKTPYIAVPTAANENAIHRCSNCRKHERLHITDFGTSDSRFQTNSTLSTA